MSGTDDPPPNTESVCPKTGGEHEWKFNGGNPMCLECGTYRGPFVQRVFPATVHEDGSIEVRIDGSDG